MPLYYTYHSFIRLVNLIIFLSFIAAIRVLSWSWLISHSVCRTRLFAISQADSGAFGIKSAFISSDHVGAWVLRKLSTEDVPDSCPISMFLRFLKYLSTFSLVHSIRSLWSWWIFVDFCSRLNLNSTVRSHKNVFGAPDKAISTASATPMLTHF